jgi:hypothetical protein
MRELVRFPTTGGAVIVEVDSDEPGFDRVARSGLIADATRRFETSLGEVRDSMAAALAIFRGGTMRPDGVEIEFGVRLNAEAGAVIAKTALEGHLVVKLSWTGDSGDQSA